MKRSGKKIFSLIIGLFALWQMFAQAAPITGPPSFGVYSTETGKVKAPRPNSILHIPLAGYSTSGRMSKTDKRQITPPSLKRHEFYGPRGVTLNSVGGYAFAKWRNYGDTWSTSLDRVAFGMRKAAELGMATVTDWAVPGNFYTDYRTTYLAAGDFTNRNFAADDWSALDLTMQIARQNKMQIVLRIPNGGPVVYGDTPTKYSSADYLDKYLKPLWGYIATRYADYADVIACIDWGFEVGIRYSYNSTFFSNTLTERVGYELADEWVSTHVALRSHIQSISPDFAVALPSTFDWIADGAGQSVKQMLDHLNAINPSYVNAFDRYALIDYYSNWDNPTLFSMVNNDPLDDGSYWGNTSWLTDGTWDEITQESVDALDSYGRTDVMLAAPEGGHYLMLQDTYNMTAGSGTVTLSLGGHNFLTTEYLSVGETVYIGNDGVEYTITALGLGTPAGSEMTVTPVSADNKSDVRIYRKEKETDQYWAMRWLYKKIAQPGSRWGFFNWFMFWDNSTNRPLDYIHYKSPGVSVYAQQGVGFVESDTLRETVRATAMQPKPVDMQWFPRYMSNDAAKGQLSVFSNVSSTSGQPSLALAVKKTFTGGTGGIAAFENDDASATPGAPFLIRRSFSGGAVSDNTNGGALRFQFHNGTSYLNRAEVAGTLLDTATGGTLLKFSTSILNAPNGGTAPALVIDERQNTHIRGSLTSFGYANSANYNLFLGNESVAPSSGVADSVSLRGVDLNGAGTTGLKILTEDNHTFEFGTKSSGTGVFVDGTQLVNNYASGAATGYIQLSSGLTPNVNTHDATFYFTSGRMTAPDIILTAASPTLFVDNFASTSVQKGLTANAGKTLNDKFGTITSSYIPYWNGSALATSAAYNDNANSRIGIGTNAPATTLHVKNDAALPVTVERSSSSAGTGILTLSNPNNTAGNSADINFTTTDSGGATYTGARIRVLHTDHADTSEDGDITFMTANSGTVAEKVRIAYDGGLKLATGTKPTCNSTYRGTLYYVAGGAGVADTYEVCTKDAADSYAWRSLY